MSPSNKRITTVTLNAAIDKTYTVPGFGLNHAFRVQNIVATAGGKGINVARVAAALGESVIATGFVAGTHGQFITKGLDSEGIAHDFVEVEGESRQCITILDPAKPNEQTELLEQGPIIDPASIADMSDKLRHLAAQSSYVVFSGSLPKGCPPEIYAALIRELQSSHPDIRIVLDTSGDALMAGVQAKPFLIKPNEHEIEKLLGKKVSSELELCDCIRDLMNKEIACVVVSLGEKGSIAGYQGKLYRVTFPPMEIVNPVGSGDSMVSGLVTALKRGESIKNALRLGTACGSANALMLGAGFVQLPDVERIYKQVNVAEI